MLRHFRLLAVSLLRILYGALRWVAVAIGRMVTYVLRAYVGDMPPREDGKVPSLARAVLKKMATDFIRIADRTIPKLMPKYHLRIDRAEIVSHVGSEGRMTSRFSFMVIISCGVATMGLLQSSPAVVIGAMLLSPLMSPIMALGFGLCIMDSKMLRKSAEALAVGTAMALLISFLLVSLSPLNDPTPEIMARTSPNLLDLVIAVFSGLAGGYSIIKRKGETLVGVAIATALMPPLAVTGYGIAVGKTAIAGGSFFLFMTNLLAIALTVTLMAMWYGFRPRHGKHYGKWQLAMVLVVFVVLSIPLGSALKHIAYETVTTRTARSIVSDYFAQGTIPARVELFQISFAQKKEVRIDTVIFTERYNRHAKKDILEKLEPALGKKVLLSLDQLVVSQEPERAQALTTQGSQNSIAVPVEALPLPLSTLPDAVTPAPAEPPPAQPDMPAEPARAETDNAL